MFGWLRRRREAVKRAEAEAEAVMRTYAIEAYAETRRREREAKTKDEAKTWSRVAPAIARKTSKRVGLDAATRMAADPNMAASFETFVSTPSATVPEIDPLDELVRLTSEGAPPNFRIQFLAVAPVRQPTVLEEVSCGLRTSRPPCVKRRASPGRRARSDFDSSIAMGVRSCGGARAVGGPDESGVVCGLMTMAGGIVHTLPS